MRELTEQEIAYRNQKLNELGQVNIDTVIGFDNGFITGLDYQQGEVERLQAKVTDNLDVMRRTDNEIDQYQTEVERLQVQNAEMLEALKMVELAYSVYDRMTDDGDITQEHKELREKARALGKTPGRYAYEAALSAIASATAEEAGEDE